MCHSNDFMPGSRDALIRKAADGSMEGIIPRNQGRMKDHKLRICRQLTNGVDLQWSKLQPMIFSG
jgi:hypothetical protein